MKPEAPLHVTLGITNSRFCLVSKEPAGSGVGGGLGKAAAEKPGGGEAVKNIEIVSVPVLFTALRNWIKQISPV